MPEDKLPFDFEGGCEHLIQVFANILHTINNDPQDYQRVCFTYFMSAHLKISTTFRLIVGYKWDDRFDHAEFLINDLSSINTMLRALFENYLNINFISKFHRSQEEKAYILGKWNKRVFSERAKMADIRGIHHQKLETERATEKSWDELLKNINAVVPEKLRFSKWPKPTDLARWDLTGMHVSHYLHFYKYYSIYAHSEPYAEMQLAGRYLGSEEPPISTTTIPSFYVFVLGWMIVDLVPEIFPEALDVLKRHKDYDKAIQFSKDYFSKDLKSRNALEK